MPPERFSFERLSVDASLKVNQSDEWETATSMRETVAGLTMSQSKRLRS